MPVKPILEATDEEWETAKRFADSVNLHVTVMNEQMLNGGRETAGFVAVSLADGRSDGVLYDTRADAVRHQSDPYNFYVKVGHNSMSLKEAWIVLNYARQAKAAGVVFADEQPALPQRLEVARFEIPRTFRGAMHHG